MHLEKYSILSDNDHLAYEFLSEGPNGTIKKLVLFQEIADTIFNIAFGDWDEKQQKINDNARSNNNDIRKVLATVAFTVIDFIKHHPRSILFAKGNTPGKTRLYQIGITYNLQEISHLFIIEGFYRNKWEPFKKGRNYQAFTFTIRS